MKERKVSATADGLRLDVYLAQALGGSRTKIQQSIKRGEVLVNGETVTPHVSLSTNDRISLPASFELKAIKSKTKTQSKAGN